ncbi:ribose-phosphate pyrophosphokinase [Diaporthe eres]
MVRNLVILGGNSHPELVNNICNFLGVPHCDRTLSKFEVGESRCEIKETVRGKDVYIIQTAGTQDPADKVNDHFIETCIMVSACKTGSAKRVTAVLPLFPYSRQPDLPYNKSGAPLNKAPSDTSGRYTFESVPATPGPGLPRSDTLSSGIDITKMMAKAALANGNGNGRTNGDASQFGADAAKGRNHAESVSSVTGNYTTHDYENPQMINAFQAKPGYKQWVAQAGTLVADLLTCAGADHPLLQRYIERNIPGYRDAVIVSPDAGGAKRATAIADRLGLSFALIHKERRPTRISDRQNATMMLVGDVTNRPCILVDDLADTANTITRAAKLLKKDGATTVYALVTHGILSGDAIERINASSIDKIIVTNSVPQHGHKAACPKLEVLDVSHVFAEAIRRVHHGESISALFPHD